MESAAIPTLPTVKGARPDRMPFLLWTCPVCRTEQSALTVGERVCVQCGAVARVEKE